MTSHATRLPVSGIDVTFRQPNGEDDMLVLEADGSSVQVALLVASRLARRSDGATADWTGLTCTDFDVLLLRLRAYLFGRQAICELRCPYAGCDAQLEIPLDFALYLDAVKPRRPRGLEDIVAGGGEPRWQGPWFQLAGARFRLPTVGDRALVRGQPDALRKLTELCIDPPDLKGAPRSRVESAMEALAPEVSQFVEGRCPGCEAPIRAFLDVAGFVVDEVRRATRQVYDEIHAIAHAYHWDEAAIMLLSRRRRRVYVDRIRQHSHVVV